MYINGIGEVEEKDVLNILTPEGKEAIESGELTMEWAANEYKLKKVKSICKIGSFGDTFSKNFDRIPEGLFEKLTPKDIANLVEAFYKCYGDGKKS